MFFFVKSFSEKIVHQIRLVLSPTEISRFCQSGPSSLTSGRKHILVHGPDWMHFKLYFQARKFKNSQNLIINFIHYENSKFCFYYKNNSDLILSHKISDENWDFTLFKSKNTLKFTLSNYLRARKYRWSGRIRSACRLMPTPLLDHQKVWNEPLTQTFL